MLDIGARVILCSVAYLGFHKGGGAKSSLATSAYTKGAKLCSIFLLCQKKNFLAKGGPWSNAPLNTPLLVLLAYLIRHTSTRRPNEFRPFRNRPIYRHQGQAVLCAVTHLRESQHLRRIHGGANDFDIKHKLYDGRYNPKRAGCKVCCWQNGNMIRM